MPKSLFDFVLFPGLVGQHLSHPHSAIPEHSIVVPVQQPWLLK